MYVDFGSSPLHAYSNLVDLSVCDPTAKLQCSLPYVMKAQQIAIDQIKLLIRIGCVSRVRVHYIVHFVSYVVQQLIIKSFDLFSFRFSRDLSTKCQMYIRSLSFIGGSIWNLFGGGGGGVPMIILDQSLDRYIQYSIRFECDWWIIVQHNKSISFHVVVCCLQFVSLEMWYKLFNCNCFWRFVALFRA